MTSEDRKRLSEIGYQVIDAKNEHVEKGWIVRVPNDDQRVLIAASEGEAWDAARDHHASMTSEVTQAALESCPFCGGMAVEETSKGPTGERYRWVQCEKCGAMSECCDDSARANNPDEPEPALLWNTRLTAQSGEGRSGAGEDAMREALADIFAAWDAHVEANDRTNAAIPPIGATRAERAVYDERYRSSEEAKREWYRAMHRFIENPAARAALSHQAIAARGDSLREALAPFGNAFLKAKADWAAGATQSAPSNLNARQSGEGEREKFLTAYVSEDSKIIGIEHDTDADWHKVHDAHIALRDRLEERIREREKCPRKPALRATDDAGGA